MSNRTTFILGLVGAAAVGVALGMLLAPEAGSNTRQKIADTADDWGHSLGDLFSSAKESVSNLARKGEDLGGQAADRYNNVKESYT
jgi:gas vesicle protein